MHAIESYTVLNISTKTVTQCMLQKLLLTYYLNISGKFIEPNRIETFLRELDCSTCLVHDTAVCRCRDNWRRSALHGVATAVRAAPGRTC